MKEPWQVAEAVLVDCDNMEIKCIGSCKDSAHYLLNVAPDGTYLTMSVSFGGGTTKSLHRKRYGRVKPIANCSLIV